MHEGQVHKNKTGKGLPYYKKTVTSTVHRHIWIDNNADYVEPVFLDETTVETVFSEFTEQALLFLNGEFVHPMHNEQLLLLS